jgi:hypothetical protein
MFYWLSNNNQTYQGDETEGLEREGLEREREREGVKKLFFVKALN